MRIINGTILDEEGRTLILRGVNLGGSSKNPFGPPGWGLCAESLKNPAEVSFVGRPFPLEDADSHFERLSRAGMTFLRLVITWEALEHAGPGSYDEAFIAYLRRILLIAEQKGIRVFIDPHQDVWSRWTGGDGAPAWTLETLGMNLETIVSSGAAITRQQSAPFPRMAWPSNYNRYAAATMFSLFFGGKTYAPDLKIEGENVQDWLQGRYIAAFRHCYRRLKNCAAIAGWGVINEPHYGFIGCRNLTQAEDPLIPMGPRPSPWDAIRSASGYPTAVPVYNALGQRRLQRTLFNAGSHSLFREGRECPWKQAGVWTDDGGAPRLLRADHFARYAGRQADFMADFHKPFTLRFIAAMREANEHTLFFIEGMPPGTNAAAHPEWKNDDPPNVINALHWYDGFTLFTKRFLSAITINPQTMRPIIGKKNIQAYFTQCLTQGARWSRAHMGGVPSLLGEFGLPFDMNDRRAFANGNYSLHEEALSMYYDAIDANLLHSTIWNYTADNTHKTGDGWNDEDLSIFSEGKERAAAGWKRPYPLATAGRPLSIEWNRLTGIFRYRFYADNAIGAPTVIYLPAEWFGAQTKIAITGTPPALRGEHKPEEQRLLIFNEGVSGEVDVTVQGDAVSPDEA